MTTGGYSTAQLEMEEKKYSLNSFSNEDAINLGQE